MSTIWSKPQCLLILFLIIGATVVPRLSFTPPSDPVPLQSTRAEPKPQNATAADVHSTAATPRASQSGLQSAPGHTDSHLVGGNGAAHVRTSTAAPLASAASAGAAAPTAAGAQATAAGAAAQRTPELASAGGTASARACDPPSEAAAADLFRPPAAVAPAPPAECSDLHGAQLTLHQGFSDYAVLQHDQPCVRGYARSPVAMTAEGPERAPLHAAADPGPDCAFEACFEPQAPSTIPLTVTLVSNQSQKVLRKVLLGDVFFCGGQSNMAMALKLTVPAFQPSDVPSPMFLAMMQVPIQEGATVANERPLQWVPLHTQSAAHVPLVKAFSAVCWHFAVHLYRALNPGPTAQRPLGLVQLTEDGTPINRFLSPARLEQCPRDLRRCRQPPGGDGCAQYEAQMLRRERRFTERGLWDSCLWPALHGMGGLPLRAFLWYQGETDKQWQGRYRCLHRELVRQVRAEAGWRGVPFVFTVVAPDLGAKGLLPFLRSDQLRLPQDEPGIGFATAHDAGDTNIAPPFYGLHPQKKQEVGRRLALVVRALAYRDTHVVYEGPVVQSHDVRWQPETRSFTIALRLSNRRLPDLKLQKSGTQMCAVCCADVPFQLWCPNVTVKMASVEIRQRPPTVVLALRKSAPVRACQAWALRYQWEDYPQCGIYNQHRLPMLPFELHPLRFDPPP